MIINKENKAILTRSDIPNENWTSQECYVVDDNSELAQKILANHPYIEYVIEDDAIADVIILPRPEIEDSEPENNNSVYDELAAAYRQGVQEA